jgi:hypothetical protein
MEWAKLDIVNLALGILNKSPAASLTDAGEFTTTLESSFDVLYPKELAAYSWRFATKIEELSVSIEDPDIDRWTYKLILPDDYLATVRVYPRVDFQIYADRFIYCNSNDVKMEFRFLVDITDLPAYFVDYLSIILAARYAKTVASDSGLAKELFEEAKDARAQALFIDSQSHPTPSIVSRPLIDVRVNALYRNDPYSTSGN